MNDLYNFFIGLETSTDIALLALSISLFGMFFTARQVSLLTRQLRLDSLIKISEANRQIVSLGFDKPNLWKIQDSNRDILDAKTAEERKRYLQLWFNHMQIVWKAHNLGLLDRHEWVACRADILDFLRIGVLRNHWNQVKPFYSKPFQKFIDGLVKRIEEGSM